MQILAGRFRGRRVRSTPTRSVRPCSSRVKKSIFDTLAVRLSFDDITVLDLFAGFGTLGFEALSRGAGTVCFVEQQYEVVQALRSTAAELRVGAAVRLAKTDVLSFLHNQAGVFDLVFCDPPYAWSDYEGLIGMVFAGGFVAADGWMLVEHEVQLDFSSLPHYAFHKDYGMTRITFFHRVETEEE